MNELASHLNPPIRFDVPTKGMGHARHETPENAGGPFRGTVARCVAFNIRADNILDSVAGTVQRNGRSDAGSIVLECTECRDLANCNALMPRRQL